MQEGMGEGEGQGEGKGQGQGQGQGEGQGQGQGEGQGQGQSEGKGEGQGTGSGEGQGEGQGDGNGDGKNGKDGENGQGYDEKLNGELFEIYKQQQQLRNQLKDRLSKEGLKGEGGKLIKEMEGVEQQLLDKGFNQRTLERMLNLQYEMLKLDEADLKQGKEQKREAITNRTNFDNRLRMKPEDIKKYFNTTEILNREALPLRQKYKTEVKKYFNKSND